MTLEQVLEPLAGQGMLAALGLTFLGGIVASGVCPCTVPMGLGVAGLAGASEARSRYAGLQVATAFFAGIVLSLTALGSVGGRLGALATESFGRRWALGIALWWPRVSIDRLTTWRRPGVLGAFGYGLVFSLGTSVAPLLLLLTIAATRAPEHALLLAFIFGLGRGFPFLLAGLAGSALTGWTRLGVWSRPIQIVSGVALLVVAAYYVDVFVQLL